MSWFGWLVVVLLLGAVGYAKRSWLYGWVYYFGYLVYVSKRVGYPKHLKLIDPVANPRKVPHSICSATAVDAAAAPAEVVPVPCLEDNYAYLLICATTSKCAAVDPCDPYVMLDAIDAWNRAHPQRAPLQLTHVLTTHRHWDHAGGNLILSERVRGLTVCGGARDSVAACNAVVRTGDVLRVGNVSVRVVETPCHTTGHVVYHVDGDAGAGALFTGDCVFSGGCGRFFEGDAQQMLTNFQALRRFPAATRMFPGHEYTVSNMRFAEFVDPTTPAVTRKLAAARALRAANGGARSTVPTTLAEEETYNPFLRTREKALRATLATLPACALPRERSNSWEDTAVLAELRRLRNANAHIPAGGNDDE